MKRLRDNKKIRRLLDFCQVSDEEIWGFTGGIITMISVIIGLIISSRNG